MKESVKVLFVNSEIYPFLPETDISIAGRYLPQGVQEAGKEIRSFMPRYGCINERRNQLHEVIRLSGMNIVIDNVDRPLIIKVSSIPSARMQVYFIDNEDYFHRKMIFRDSEEKYFSDNDERAIFFARGVLETVKKLRWKPDIIHCQGWISHLLPLYLKKAYIEDPVFTESKIILSLYNDALDQTFSDKILSKISIPGLEESDLDVLKKPNGINLAKLAILNADALICGEPKLESELNKFAIKSKLPYLPYTEIKHPDDAFIKEYNTFYDQILESR